MILHIDMDAFYASVEQRDNPQLAGKPVVVGGSPQGRGVISAASYEARQFGIHSAMPASQALRLCPQAVFIRPRMDHYAAISKQIRNIFFDYTSLVEPLSLDEAFLDVTGSTRLFGDAETIALRIKQRIQAEVGLVASAGVAPNKYLAKVASDLEKPDGLVVVKPKEVQAFLDPLRVNRIWGVGKQTQKRLASLGVETIGQLRRIPSSVLKAKFGVNSNHFWRLSRGLDTRQVVPDRIAKSVSHETTFAADVFSLDALIAWTLELADQVARRLRRHDIIGRTVQVKIRYSNFETITRARTLGEPTDSSQLLADTGRDLVRQELEDNRRGIRLIGMGVRNLKHHGPNQLMLFDNQDVQRNRCIDATTDEIRDRFGGDALRRGTTLEHRVRHRPDPRIE